MRLYRPVGGRAARSMMPGVFSRRSRGVPLEALDHPEISRGRGFGYRWHDRIAPMSSGPEDWPSGPGREE
jgi:hypothetical protein